MTPDLGTQSTHADREVTGPVLAVDGLSVDVRTGAGPARAVSNASFKIHPGETLGIVGESGCGKSLTIQAIAGLLPPVASVVGGEAVLDGKDLLRLSPRRRRALAGPQLSVVFQDALRTLNPVLTVGTQLAEPFRIHRNASRREAGGLAVNLMERVGIPDAAMRAKAYPHQFSGGMCQRLHIAMAVALAPQVLLADEPTTALDVTVQAQIMDLLTDLSAEHRMALILVTHDLAILSRHADTVAVMYAGTVVETGPVREVFTNPRHPYTRGLLRSVVTGGPNTRLQSISGTPPSLHAIPSGCPFQDRCSLVEDVCRSERPKMLPVGSGGHASACHMVGEPT